MKKVFTFLSCALVTSTVFGQVITQSATPTVVLPTGSVACGSQAAGYTSDNSYTRAFKLSDYGITYDFTITNVSFGVQTANGTFPVNVSISTTTGVYPSGVITQIGASVPVTVSSANAGGLVNTGASLNKLVPAGSTFILKINHDGSATVPTQNFYMGTNDGPQTGQSYLSSTDCGGIPPTATGTGPLVTFASAKWVMTVTGENAALGTTEVINSRDLQIYPNPVKDILRFKFGNNLRSESIDIYDMSGRVLTAIANSKNVNEVNLASYPKGNYILKVKANDGRVYIQKIIKE